MLLMTPEEAQVFSLLDPATGNSVTLRFGVDLYNASDDTPAANSLGWNSVPSEWVGFWYSSIPTSGTLFTASGNVVCCLNTKADVDATVSSGVVKDSNFHAYRIPILKIAVNFT